MKYYIEKYNRTVELDDELVAEYQKVETLGSGIFVIALLSQFGHYPTEKEMSDSSLSIFCNKILLDDLKMSIEFPKVVEWIDRNETQLRETSSLREWELERI